MDRRVRARALPLGDSPDRPAKLSREFSPFCPAGRRKRRHAARKATKSAGTEFVIPYTGARAIRSGDHPSPLCTKTEKGSIIGPAMRGEFRGIWRLVLRMQEAGARNTLPLHCVFYLPCDSIIILNLPNFNR